MKRLAVAGSILMLVGVTALADQSPSGPKQGGNQTQSNSQTDNGDGKKGAATNQDTDSAQEAVSDGGDSCPCQAGNKTQQEDSDQGNAQPEKAAAH